MSGAGLWRVVSASVEGSRHATTGLPCQDAHRALVVDDSHLVVAVADGAGSARLADVGAQLASGFAAELVAQLLTEEEPAPWAWDALLDDVLEATHRRLIRHADRLGCDGRDLATTLLLAVATGDVVAVAQVGDGAVVVTRDDDRLEVAAGTRRTEYLNETAFLTGARWRDDMTVDVIPAVGVVGVSVLTDGLQLLALDLASNEPHAPFFAPLHAFARSADPSADELASFLRSPRVCARTDDDKTLVLAARVDP